MAGPFFQQSEPLRTTVAGFAVYVHCPECGLVRTIDVGHAKAFGVIQGWFLIASCRNAHVAGVAVKLEGVDDAEQFRQAREQVGCL